ncbi:MAG TPA: DUF899 family protein [Solirubrobacteraceae bacterium]|nr:DUF899 family protein [Solirubrobacteraceae bacterium]
MYAPHVVSDTEWAQTIAELHAEEKRATDGRGVEALGSVGRFLDLTPFGRQEKWEDSPDSVVHGEPYLGWRRHDEYEAVPAR